MVGWKVGLSVLTYLQLKMKADQLPTIFCHWSGASSTPGSQIMLPYLLLRVLLRRRPVLIWDYQLLTFHFSLFSLLVGGRRKEQGFSIF